MTLRCWCWRRALTTPTPWDTWALRRTARCRMRMSRCWDTLVSAHGRDADAFHRRQALMWRHDFAWLACIPLHGL